jgi:DNA-binding LacI/PurR family transcriptional regulator
MNKILEAKEVINKHIVQLSTNKKHRLPSERSLAEKFGYSRGTIGKALGALAAEGTILRKHGAGTFISDKTGKRALTIAIVMRTAYHYTDVHFRLIVEEVSKYAEKNDIYIQIFDRLPDMFKDDPEQNSLIQAIKNGIVDGVLISSRMPVDIIYSINALCPTVIINNVLGVGDAVPCISCDHFRVGFLAGKHLLEKGHRKVAYITDSLAHPESYFELSGFKSALEMGGVRPEDVDILETRRDSVTFTRRVLNFFKNSACTGCFERHTPHALKIISILSNNGIKVPEDVSIISGGNYGKNKTAAVKLTVIDHQLNKMCRLGLETLQNTIKNNSKTNGGIKFLDPRIIENNSVINIIKKGK